MDRRRFLETSLAAAAATSAASGLASAAPASSLADLDYYEWRTYRIADARQQALVLEYLEAAFVPAWNRAKGGPIGAFTEMGDSATLDVHLLLTYRSSFSMSRIEVWHDEHYQQAAAKHFAVKPDAPAFSRIDSSIMVAFTGAPKLTLPAAKPRILELRTYESHSEERARKKVDMFNNGEIPIFPKCGFENVFFGETLVGSGLPNLKYMLAAPDMAANEAGWKKFMADPDFTALKDDPQYADTVSKIVKLFLKPTDYSQV